MANTTSSIIYNGYTYKVGDTIRLNNNTLYTSITASSGNTINMLSQCTMQIVAIWEGSSGGVAVKNPLQLKWVSGPSGSQNGGGYARLNQIVTGSGGTPNIQSGNLAVYAFDQRTNTTFNAGSWAESFYVDWNSFKGDISHYEIWYQEAPDAGNKPGTWSGRVRVGNVNTTSSSGSKIIGTLDQSRSTSDWGGRGYWYRFSVVAIGKNGGNTSTSLFTNHLRKCTTSTISFNLNGGTGAPTTQYKFAGYTFKFPNAPAKSGYSFKNWSGSQGSYNAGQMVYINDSNTTYTAQWEKSNYKNQVNVYINGITSGNGSHGNAQKIRSAFIECAANSSITLNETVFGKIPNGYNPTQPFEDTTGKPKYNWGQTITQKAYNMNLHEWFDPVNYKISYNLDGGINNVNNPTSYTVVYPVKFYSPTKQGHTFIGWENNLNSNLITGLNENADNSKVIMGTNFNYDTIMTELDKRTATNITLTAKWKANIYTVHFNAGDGNVQETERNVAYGEVIGMLPVADKPFYKFVGWFTSSVGGTRIDENTVVYNNITYYAYYESRFYVYTNGSWHHGEIYGYKTNEWIHHVPTVRKNNNWRNKSFE